MQKRQSCRHPLDPLVDVMARLRGPDGCPWDLEQDHQSLKKYLIEEAYEVLDAIDATDEELIEELGDVLLQVVFHSQIASETGRFDVDDVVRRITEKLIYRHPHIFGDGEAADTDAVLRNWERLKQQEKGDRYDKPISVLDGVPRSLPALMYAHEVQSRAAKVGFDWDDPSGALTKVAEEAREIAAADSAADAEEEWGDLIFSIVNAARTAGVDPENALRASADKFVRRFTHIETRAQAEEVDLQDMSLVEMDALWNEAKAKEKGRTSK